MAFKNPVVSPLTQNQEKLLGQLGSLKNILTLPSKPNLNIPEDKQVSSFDYLLRIAEATVGAAFVDIILKKFIDEIFNTQSDKLERMILKGIGKSLDAQGHHISPNPQVSNESWLATNAAGPLHVSFQIVKALLVKQIIAMIFGPATKMSHNTQGYPTNLGYNDNITPTLPTQDETLNNVLAADSMFSISNATSNQYGDQEYNLIQLKERLIKGEVIFTISCQDIKITLPPDFDNQLDNMISTVVTLAGESNSGSGQVPNPAAAFNYVGVHVANETQRINTPENSNAVRKSFLQILVDKIINLLVISLSPYLASLINQINTTNPTLNLTIIGLLSSPEELKKLSTSDENSFNTKSIFISSLTNALYALLISMLLKGLIKEIKKLIKNALAKRAAIKLQSKFKRFAAIQNAIKSGVDTASKAQQSASALKEFDSIFKFGDLG